MNLISKEKMKKMDSKRTNKTVANTSLPTNKTLAQKPDKAVPSSSPLREKLEAIRARRA